VQPLLDEADGVVLNFGLHYHDMNVYRQNMTELARHLTRWLEDGDEGRWRHVMFRETSAQHFVGVDGTGDYDARDAFRCGLWVRVRASPRVKPSGKGGVGQGSGSVGASPNGESSRALRMHSIELNANRAWLVSLFVSAENNVEGCGCTAIRGKDKRVNPNDRNAILWDVLREFPRCVCGISRCHQRGVDVRQGGRRAAGGASWCWAGGVDRIRTVHSTSLVASSRAVWLSLGTLSFI